MATLQTIVVWRIGARLLIVQGTSFAAVSTMIAIGAPLGGEAGLRAIFGALIVAGAIAFLIAPFLRMTMGRPARSRMVALILGPPRVLRRSRRSVGCGTRCA